MDDEHMGREWIRSANMEGMKDWKYWWGWGVGELEWAEKIEGGCQSGVFVIEISGVDSGDGKV